MIVELILLGFFHQFVPSITVRTAPVERRSVTGVVQSTPYLIQYRHNALQVCIRMYIHKDSKILFLKLMIIYVAQSSKDSEVRADENLRIEKFGPPSRLKFWLRKSLILEIITNHRVGRLYK